MAVVVAAFESWLETLSALIEKRGAVLEADDIGFAMSLYRDGLDPEQAAAEVACL
jgi:hypothetical protein